MVSSAAPHRFSRMCVYISRISVCVNIKEFRKQEFSYPPRNDFIFLLYYIITFQKQGVQRRMVFISGQFFHIFEIEFVCFVTAIFDLVHDVDALFHIP